MTEKPRRVLVTVELEFVGGPDGHGDEVFHRDGAAVAVSVLHAVQASLTQRSCGFVLAEASGSFPEYEYEPGIGWVIAYEESSDLWVEGMPDPERAGRIAEAVRRMNGGRP